MSVEEAQAIIAERAAKLPPPVDLLSADPAASDSTGT